MLLYLMRHGEAEALGKGAAAKDSDRALTPKGRKRAKRTGQALRRIGHVPALVVSSPHARAMQTAEIVVAAMKHRRAVVVRRDLATASSLVAVAEDILASGEKSVMLVGHEPTMSELARALSGGDAWGNSFTKGMVLVLRWEKGSGATPLFRVTEGRTVAEFH